MNLSKDAFFNSAQHAATEGPSTLLKSTPKQAHKSKLGSGEGGGGLGDETTAVVTGTGAGDVTVTGTGTGCGTGACGVCAVPLVARSNTKSEAVRIGGIPAIVLNYS